MKERKKGAVWDWFLRIADSRYQILGAPTTHSSELRATQLKQRGMKRENYLGQTTMTEEEEEVCRSSPRVVFLSYKTAAEFVKDEPSLAKKTEELYAQKLQRLPPAKREKIAHIPPPRSAEQAPAEG